MGVAALSDRGRAVAIVDRDGTIVAATRDASGAVSSAFEPDELRLLPGAVDGLRALADAGFVLAIATNQPGAAKGQATVAQIERTNAALVARLGDAGVTIAALEVCLHHPVGGPGGDATLVRACACRKPAPGMVRALLDRLGGARQSSWMIGDSAVDAEAGRGAGVRTALIGDRAEITAVVRGATLQDVAGEILRQR